MDREHDCRMNTPLLSRILMYLYWPNWYFAVLYCHKKCSLKNHSFILWTGFAIKFGARLSIFGSEIGVDCFLELIVLGDYFNFVWEIVPVLAD